MNQEVLRPESLARIACFAAIELERIANKKETTAENIGLFSRILAGNFSIEEPRAAYISEPLTAYAVSSVFLETESRNQSITDVVNNISEKLTKPMQNIYENFASGTIDMETKDVVELAKRCLQISEVCTSFNSNFDDLEIQPNW